MTSDKQCVTSNKQCVTNDKQCVTSDQQYVTSGKQCVTSAVVWSAGEPNFRQGGGEARCVVMSSSGQWKDNLCGIRRRYFCKAVPGSWASPSFSATQTDMNFID